MQNCNTPYCKNKSKKKHCSKCYSRMARSKNPMLHSYLNLKANAKRRGKVFELTYEQFQGFCYETNYIQGRGRTKTSFSIDRIDNMGGYTIDNIRVLTLSENAIKGKKILEYDLQTKFARVYNTKRIDKSIEDDLPF